MKRIKTILLSGVLFGFLLIPLSSSQAHTRIVVRIHPPAPKVVVRPAPRHVGYVWMSGHWRWHHGRYVWVKGRWVRPRPGLVWVDGHWRRVPRGWVWVPGHWRRTR